MFSDMRHGALDFLLRFFLLLTFPNVTFMCYTANFICWGFIEVTEKLESFLPFFLFWYLNFSKDIFEAVMSLHITIVSNALSCY